ncbi:MAG: hypothetical protein ACRD3V_20705 [Vicinamibacteria bacterium]
MKWAIPAAPIVLVCWRIVVRRPEKTVLVLSGLTTVALTLGGLQLLHMEWIDVPRSIGSHWR